MPLLQVFEHDILRIGDSHQGVVFEPAHFDALARLATRLDGAYFTLLHRAVRFRHYVGVIQAGELTIEILPKADRDAAPARSRWQRVLLDLLQECRLWPGHTLPAAGQGLRQHSLLEVYVHHFLEETTVLLRQGLLRAYRRQADTLPVVRGRLRPEQQLRRNAARIDRFYTEHDCFDYQHLFNQLLWGGLHVLRSLPLPAAQRDRLEQCRLHFPAGVDEPPPVLPPWEALTFTRRTDRYRPAVQMAWLLLNRYQPDLRAGRFPVIALLFDMNRLFEEFVFRQMQKAVQPGDRLARQTNRPFWSGQRLRPDIVWYRSAGNIVLDTKWKVLRRRRPDSGDLQQLFAYLHYFHAVDGVLVYPQVYGWPDLQEPFHPPAAGRPIGNARLLFVDVVNEQGMLNRSLGKELLGRLMAPR